MTAGKACVLDDEIIDALGLERVGNGLGRENRQHHWYRVRERVGQFEHDDCQRDRRALVIDDKLEVSLDVEGYPTVTPESVAAAPTYGRRRVQ